MGGYVALDLHGATYPPIQPSKTSRIQEYSSFPYLMYLGWLNGWICGSGPPWSHLSTHSTIQNIQNPRIFKFSVFDVFGMVEWVDMWLWASMEPLIHPFNHPKH